MGVRLCLVGSREQWRNFNLAADTPLLPNCYDTPNPNPFWIKQKQAQDNIYEILEPGLWKG